MHIIPAIDIISGKCVRLTKGDYNTKKIYNEDPLEVAKTFEDIGIKKLHLVDLDGAKAKSVVNYKVLGSICSRTTLEVDFGGGVQSHEDLQKVFDHGAIQVTGGSIAVKKPEVFEEWLALWGQERIILGADTKGGKIAISGWEEKSEIDLFDFIDFWIQKGVKYIISTDVNKDGMLQGPSFEMYKEIQATFPEINLIASGGVGKYSDLEELREIGVYGTILGKAIYENKISMKQLGGLVC